MQRHILRIAVLTVLAFALQAINGPAAQALQQMRAAKCCAENCKHAQSFTSPSRCGCCQMAAAPDNATAATKGKPELSAAETAALANIDCALPPAAVPALLATFTGPPRAAPVFLLTLNIRL